MGKKETWYRQCTYELDLGSGRKVGTSWIPENLAKVGKRIYFGEKQENPKELWTVVSVGSRKEESFLKRAERINRNYRKNTDI